MKHFFTFLISSALLFGAGISHAQTDITPSRYKFADQPLGAYRLDKQYVSGNPPAYDPDVTDHWNNGFITIGQPNFPTSLTFDDNGQGASAASSFQIFNMGGEVGKVLMMKFPGSNFEYGVAGKPGLTVTWWTCGFYSDPVLTPTINGFVTAGDDTETATKKATVRLRVVFHIHQNELSYTDKAFDILAYTFANNHKKDADGNIANSPLFYSGDFTDEVLNTTTFEYEHQYNPDKWIACEYDFVVPETSGVPIRFSLRMGNVINSTILIKEMTMTANPTGEAVAKEVLTIHSDPTATGAISIQEPEAGFLAYSRNGQLILDRVQINSKVDVYSITGSKIRSLTASNSTIQIPVATQGIYIVRVGDSSKKVVVK
jgi:hypothetical protein